MAQAHNNLTVSREIYDAIVRQKEYMRQKNTRCERAPSMNDALAQLISGTLTEGTTKRQMRRNRVDRIVRDNLIR